MGDSTSPTKSWTQIRGDNRDGRVPSLPENLDFLKAPPAWTANIPGGGIGGICVAKDMVVVGSRDLTDKADLWMAFQSKLGIATWTATYMAPAELDYGNTPRATAVFAEGVLVTQGATGVVSGLDATTGIQLWRFSMPGRFAAELPTWGFCGTPLVTDESVILTVSSDPSFAAVDLFTGKTKWKAGGTSAAYASPVLSSDQASFITIDSQGPVARSVKDGKVLWQHKPEIDGDFGVPCPVQLGDALVFVGENNGVLRRDANGTWSNLDEDLIPDSHTPVALGDDLLVAFEGLHRIDGKTGKRHWSTAESKILGYASIISDDQRVLVMTEDASMLLFDAVNGKLISDVRLTEDDVRTLAHPAIVDGFLYVLVGNELRAYQW